MKRTIACLAGICLTLVATGLLLTTPIGALLVLAPLEHRAEPRGAQVDGGIQAIVLLGGGAHQRLQVAAELARSSPKPILVTGKGLPSPPFQTEADRLVSTLHTEYSLSAKWIDQRATDTDENAFFACAMLRPEGITRIALVTDVFHMPRARRWFEHFGFTVVEFPASTAPNHPTGPASWVPSRAAWKDSRLGLHEWIGLIQYSLVAPFRSSDCSTAGSTFTQAASDPAVKRPSRTR